MGFHLRHLRWAAIAGMYLGLACSGRHTRPAAAAPAAAPAPAARTAKGLIDGPDGRRFAVVRPVSFQSECSGLGGDHWVLEIDEPGRSTPRLAHAGGHGVRLQLAQVPIGSETPKDVKYYVAELQMAPPPSREGLDPWCIVGMPAFDAMAHRMIAAPDLEAARRLLAIVAERGMPPPMATLGPAPDGRESIAVARVQRRELERGHFALESVDGTAPASIDLESARDFQVRVGDLLVVASVDGRVTRLLAPDDRTASMRWAAIVRQEGWPPPVLQTRGEDSRLVTRRWSMLGMVREGREGCGPSIEGETRYTVPRGPAPRWSAAAPAGVQPGDTVMTVVVPRFEEDACGHTLRAIRVYANPDRAPSWDLFLRQPSADADSVRTPIVE